MEDSVLLVVLISKKSGELPAVSVDHCQVEWTKVPVEGEIGEVVVDVEEEGVLEVLWRLGVRDPVKLVLNNLDGFSEDLLFGDWDVGVFSVVG